MHYTNSQIKRLSFKKALKCCGDLEIDVEDLSRIQKRMIRDAIRSWMIEDPEGYSDEAAERLDRRVERALGSAVR